MPARRSHVKGCVVHGASFCPCRMVADGGRGECDGLTTKKFWISRVLTLEPVGEFVGGGVNAAMALAFAESSSAFFEAHELLPDSLN